MWAHKNIYTKVYLRGPQTGPKEVPKSDIGFPGRALGIKMPHRAARGRMGHWTKDLHRDCFVYVFQEPSILTETSLLNGLSVAWALVA